MAIRLLVIEDSRDDIDLLARALKAHFGAPVTMQAVSTRKDMERAIRESTWDAIVCDYALPGFEWPGALEVARSFSQDIIFVVISGSIDDDRGMLAIRQGADEYLAKDKLSRLGPLIDKLLLAKETLRKNQQVVSNLLDRLDPKKNDAK